MPLTDEQKAAIATLADANEDEVAAELKDKAQPIYQRIFRGGHATATNDAKAEKKRLEADLTAEREAREAAEQQLTEARKNQPDVERLNADWQAKYERDLTAAQQAAAAEKQARQQEREARKLSDLRAHLTGIDPEYARWKAAENAARLHTRDDGTVELREPGSEVPVQIPAGKTPYEVLADEIARSVPAALRLSNADTGGGASSGGGAGRRTDEDYRKAVNATADYTL